MEGEMETAPPQCLTVQDFVDRIHKDPYDFINGVPDLAPTPKNEAKPARQLVKNVRDGSLLVTDLVKRLYRNPAGFINGQSNMDAAPPSVIFGEAAKVRGLEPEKEFIQRMLLLKHAPSYLKAGKDEASKPESSRPKSDTPDPTELESLKVEHIKPGFAALGSSIIAVRGLVAQVIKPITKITGHPGVHLSTHSQLRPAPAESSTGTVPPAPTANEVTENMRENGSHGAYHYNFDGGRVSSDGFPRVGGRFMLKGSFEKLTREKLQQGAEIL
ncbi:hypothetical protein BGX38DRAFT_801453 [Terfezia claveryi]|nr:hypothetical protein BGX38DRAFT_801453 [Terfezia claveryi]